MNTQNQIKLIKAGYVITLLVVFLFSLKDAVRGFQEGHNGEGNGTLIGFLQGLVVFVITFLALRVLVYLYRFIDSVQIGHVFSEDNVSRLKRMGWYCTTIPFILFLFKASVYIHRNSYKSDLALNIIENVDFQIWLLIFGLTLLTIAFVFNKGILLQRENDLTI
ncbi:DUF2975 domain-containing protein [Pedobacter sp. Leaf176]|uniref:DUF2975 domain-containing protein n=1 Tax=Pedobacter sp. Leaf176 TaxID=1736286 RepID=UPI0006F3B196|nr:DUF2975 domain-containing protein [Pedobacter sp. Leaf176]KQR70343.1 hypothetical protein ASF92_10180 [Pedobacter sp. Leaf176]